MPKLDELLRADGGARNELTMLDEQEPENIGSIAPGSANGAASVAACRPLKRMPGRL
jgi:hypothetical protein